jgi:flagellar basal-body rod protein FlgB
MAITDLNLFSMLRTRMQWHQERQKLLAENVSNADTRGYRPRDLAPPDFSRAQAHANAISLNTTSPSHIAGSAGGGTQFAKAAYGGHAVRPSGNAVNLEDEMIKVANNQMDYQQVTTLYSRSLALIKTAVGKR